MMSGDCMWYPGSDNPPPRTLENAGSLYMKIRRCQSERVKNRIFSKFEGAKFFRYGTTWRRKDGNGLEIVLPDKDYMTSLYLVKNKKIKRTFLLKEDNANKTR